MAISDNKIAVLIDELEGYVEPPGDTATPTYVPDVRTTGDSEGGGSDTPSTPGTSGSGSDEDENLGEEVVETAGA